MINNDRKTFFSGEIQNFKMKGNGIQLIQSNDLQNYEITKGYWENDGKNDICKEPMDCSA